MMNNATDMIEPMKTTGLVPLFSHDDAAITQDIVAAVYQGGVRVLEFTNRKQNALSVFTQLINNRHQYPGMKIGIGTVMDADTTKKFIDAGADFIISPIMKPEMAEVCKTNNIPWIPGCGTLTEIVNARDLGAPVMKVFPGSVLGPGFVSSILPVVPDLKLMITGGVESNEENLRSWFKAGSLCVGLGSHLFTSDILNKKEWNTLQRKVEETLAIIRKIKADLK